MTFLIGEVVTAPLLMAAALGVAFIGSIGIGVYVLRHTVDRFTSTYDVGTPQATEAHHAV